MKKIIAIGAILAIVSLIGPVFAVPALAQSSESGDISPVYLDQPTLTRVAQALGLSPAELTASLQAGKTLAQIAADQKVAQEKVVEAIISPYRDELQLRVKYGYLTQQQFDSLLAEAQQHAQTLLQQDLSNASGNGDYSWEDMQADCGQMMGGWSGSQGSWGGMMGPNNMMAGWGGMMGGWNYQGSSYQDEASRNSGPGLSGMMNNLGNNFNCGWNNMMGGGWGGMM